MEFGRSSNSISRKSTARIRIEGSNSDSNFNFDPHFVVPNGPYYFYSSHLISLSNFSLPNFLLFFPPSSIYLNLHLPLSNTIFSLLSISTFSLYSHTTHCAKKFLFLFSTQFSHPIFSLYILLLFLHTILSHSTFSSLSLSVFPPLLSLYFHQLLFSQFSHITCSPYFVILVFPLLPLILRLPSFSAFTPLFIITHYFSVLHSHTSLNFSFCVLSLFSVLLFIYFLVHCLVRFFNQLSHTTSFLHSPHFFTSLFSIKVGK